MRQGIVLLGLSEQASNLMDYELAIDYCQRAKHLLELAGDEWGVNVVWNDLAEYYIYLGRIEQAFQAYRELRNFSDKLGNRRMLGTNYSWESLQATRYTNLDYALEMRKKSLEIAIEVENQNDIAYHTWELGEIFRLMGALEQARKYYQEALPLFEKLQDHVGIGFYHRGCGEIAMTLGNWVEARNEFEQALITHAKEQRS
jgi:tetratricopeptide (TPR) repeat protein